MKKTAVFIVLIIILSGCNSNMEKQIAFKDNKLSELNQSILDLETKNEGLELENLTLVNSVDQLKVELDSCKQNYDDNITIKDEKIKTLEEQNEYISQQSEYFSQRYYEQIELINSLINTYDITDIKVGDVINGFEIINIDLSKYSDIIGEFDAKKFGKENEDYYSIQFDGTFVLDGKLINDCYMNPYSFMVDSIEVINNMPLTNETYDYCLNNSSYLTFNIINEEVLIEKIGKDIAEELYTDEDASYDIVGVFKNYNYKSPLFEGSSDSIELVDIISIEKSIKY